ncbi:MAG TPA: hypothetical protein VFO17_00280 [Acidimicrobiia bacterium]|jgi:hypothetical protein|nr:hypothetical protein [Acidimicrobiia bacterium]
MKSPRWVRQVILLGAAGFLLAGCASGESDLVTVTDDQSLARFDVPKDWHTYDLDELSTLETLPFDAPYQGFTFPAITSIGFDGAPVQDVTRLTESVAEADYPIGAASVRQIGDLERDFLSRSMLTQSVVPYATMPNPEEITKEDFSFGNGFDGVRALVSFESATGNDLGVAYMISVSDPDDRRIYSIAAGCNRDCFIANQDTITKVVDSWLVNKKG